MPRWRWILLQVSRRLWVRATLIGALGVVAAMLAAVVEHYIPWELPGSIGADAVDSILTIIASSMLAVTTFSLSVLTSAYGAAANGVTPRATKLVMEDKVTHNVLSTFIGSFLFAIVGIVVLKTGAYGARGRVILFIVTIAVIVLIVVSLLRWIDHLTRLGRLGETTGRVEEAARKAIETRLADPYLGGRPLREVPQAAVPVLAGAIGYVQHVDMDALARRAGDIDADLFITALPGVFVYPDTPLAWIGPCPPRTGDREATADEEEQEALLCALRKAFSVGNERGFDQDPRFGLAVMSEIGSRALSPATNDPGTAIDVIGRATRLMALWAEKPEDAPDQEPRYPRVHVEPLDTRDLFEDAFMLMARDGAGLVEVQLRLLKSLAALARMGGAGFRSAALDQARLALARAEAALALDADRERLRAVARECGIGAG